MRKILVLGLMAGLSAITAFADTTGTCSVHAGDTEGKLEFSSSRGDCVAGQHCHQNDSDMLWSKWTGITPQDLEHEGATLDARMKAEAGEIRCVGAVHETVLRGTYSFTPNEAFVRQMEAMGFTDVTSDRLQSFAILDITTEWTKEMKDAGVTESDHAKLVRP